VTNVTAFGAFVDVGVHQDGLVHVSQLSTRFVKDPSEVVKVGDRLTVKVLSVDLARKRLALSVRAVQEGGTPPPPSGRPPAASTGRMTTSRAPPSKPAPAEKKGPEPFNNPFRNIKR
jgi:protein Tex